MIIVQVTVGSSFSAKVEAYASSRASSSSRNAAPAMSSKQLAAQGYSHAVVTIAPQEVESGPADSVSWQSEHGLTGFTSLGTSAADKAGKRVFGMPGSYDVTFQIFPLLPHPKYLTKQPSAGPQGVDGLVVGNQPVSSVAYRVQVVRPSPEHADECVCRKLPEQARIGCAFSLDLELRMNGNPVDLADCSFARLKLRSEHLDCR